MKLRYMREQRDRAREMLEQKDQEIEDRKDAKDSGHLSTKQARKRTKFQLDSDSDNNDVFVGFTHKGKLLGAQHDDFNEDISQDSDDDKNDRNNRKGFLNEEMVEKLNFGGGENGDGMDMVKEKKKSRKEVFEEIIEKSKSYDAARKEMKQINMTMQRELNDDFQGLLKVLKYNKDTVDPITENAALHEKMANKKPVDAKTGKAAAKPKLEEQSYE